MTKNKEGRPTLYSKEILKKAEEYLEFCEDEEIEEEKREDWITYKTKVKLPTKGGLARYLGVSRDTLYEWASVHPEFSYIMEILSAEQEDRLINNGLSGDYNSTIAKLLLSKHGYAEKTETDLTSKGEKLAPAVQITGMQIIKDEPNADSVQDKKRKTNRGS